MTPREVAAAAIGLVLIGFFAGWCAGWAARGEQNRTWHHTTAWRIAALRTELDQALDQLDAAHAHREAARVTPPATPTVIHVHVATPLPCTPHPPPLITRAPDGLAILPGRELGP